MSNNFSHNCKNNESTRILSMIQVADDPFIHFKPQTALHDLIENLCIEAGFYPRKVFEGYEIQTLFMKIYQVSNISQSSPNDK